MLSIAELFLQGREIIEERELKKKRKRKRYKENVKKRKKELRQNIVDRVERERHKKRHCGDKIPHSNNIDAQRHLARLHKCRRAEYEIYNCNYCGYMHVGRKKK